MGKMKIIVVNFPICVALSCLGLSIILKLKEPNLIIEIIGCIVYAVGFLFAVLAWQKIIRKINEQEEHINDVEYVLTQAKKDIALHEELITTLNKAVFFDTCHEVLPDIEAEGENNNE